MIVKLRDAQPEVIKSLEQQSELTTEVLKKNACISAALRLRADTTTQRATELVDFFFGQRDDWAVIHDLRLRIGSHALQFNHLLVHNSLQIICLDTRYLDCHVKYEKSGQYRITNAAKPKLIASPVTKMAKDVRLVKSSLPTLGWVPKRFGFTLHTDVFGGVLVAPDSPEEGSKRKYTDIGIHRSEAYLTELSQLGSSRLSGLRGRLSTEKLQELAISLVQHHLPIYPAHLLGGKDEIASAA